VPELLFVHPERLRPNSWNPNFLAPENEAKLAASLEELGQFKPIVVREKPDGKTDFEILGGEQRWHTASAAGRTEVSIFNLGEIDDDLAKRISLADNARYGIDDAAALAALFESVGNAEEIQRFLPYTDTDISSIFSASVIALDELELPESFDPEKPELPAEKAERVPKTHTIMRFKVPLTDAERITEIIAKIQKRQGYTSSDELTNAGDALVHALFAEAEPT
jgi:hypothetical protein